MVEGTIEVPTAKDEHAPDIAPDGVSCKICSASKSVRNDSIIGDVIDSRPSIPKLMNGAAFTIIGEAISLAFTCVRNGTRLGARVDTTLAEDEIVIVATSGEVICTTSLFPPTTGYGGDIGGGMREELTFSSSVRPMTPRGGTRGVVVSSGGSSIIVDFSPASINFSSASNLPTRPVEIIPISSGEKWFDQEGALVKHLICVLSTYLFLFISSFTNNKNGFFIVV